MSVTPPRPGTSYVLRKLHSLSGIVPIGAFLLEHFWSNSAALVGAEKYNSVSQELQTIPFRVVAEALFIWIPILYHGIYGVYIWRKGESNVSEYPWIKNWMYTFQRYTGLIAFVFIGWHVYSERFLTHGKSTYSDMARVVQNAWFLAFYSLGVIATSFHLGVGVWNFACKWGLAVTQRAQSAVGKFGVLVGIAFSVVGILILTSFRLDWHPFAFYVNK